MTILDKITEGCKVQIEGKTYAVLGKTMYVTQNNPDAPYAKMLLENHFVLVVSPVDGIAYFGKNEGRVPAFDGFPSQVQYEKENFEQVAHDYQIVVNIVFGNPLLVEGEVEYWDYEAGNKVISTAVTSRGKERADVIAHYIELSDIAVI